MYPQELRKADARRADLLTWTAGLPANLLSDSILLPSSASQRKGGLVGGGG